MAILWVWTLKMVNFNLNPLQFWRQNLMVNGIMIKKSTIQRFIDGEIISLRMLRGGKFVENFQ